MMKGLHNWIAIVAVLAVTLLGAAALGRASSERDHTMRNAVVALCERQNVGRYQIDVEFERLDKVTVALSRALTIAQNRSKFAQDATSYAVLRSQLDQLVTPSPLKLVDCDKEVPSP